MAISFCNKVLAIRQDATFGADLITGFPTETHKMFKDTLNLVDECHLTHLHVFPYSARENTPAAHMPQVHKSVIKDRANILRKKGMEKLKTHIENKVGGKDLILIEKNHNEKSIGKDQNFFNVILDEKIRPAVAKDGGDIKFEEFKDGVVKVKLQGSCSGCPSSTMTLKQGVQNLLCHYLPEVKRVESIWNYEKKISIFKIKSYEI